MNATSQMDVKEKNAKPEMITDEAIEKGLERLTPERIKSVILQVLEKETGARFKAYVQTCMRCGLCSKACSYYLSNDNDPSFSPAAKVKQTVWEMMDKRGEVSKDFLRRAVRIAHLQCNLCRRCSMYCPFGIDIAYMMLLVRRIVHKLGITPPLHPGYGELPFGDPEPDVGQGG